jgi:hypothetical protein
MNTRVESIPLISEEECDGRLFLPSQMVRVKEGGD